MSDEYKPEPIILSGTPTLSSNPQPILTGAPTALSGGGMSTQGPMDSANVKFVTGPDGQMIAVQKEPFVWKKFFIGLGIPIFLMILPILMAIILEINDSGYEEEYYVDLKRTDGTAYEAGFSLDAELELDDCDIDENWAHMDYDRMYSDEIWFCNDQNQIEFFHIFEDELNLSRQNGTLYEIEYPISENYHTNWCELEVAESSPGLNRYYNCDIIESNLTFTQYNSTSMNLTRQNGTEYQANFSFDATTSNLYLCDFPSQDGSYYWHECETEYLEENDEYIVSISRLNYDGELQPVGHWNSTAQILHYDVGYDFGSEITIEYNIESIVGGTQQGDSTIQFDSGFSHEEVRIHLEVHKLVGGWNGSGGVMYFDDGLDHGDEIRINIVAIDPIERDKAEENYDQMEPLISMSGILCCLSPLLSIGLIIYGFAVTGGKGIGIGATTSLILYPFIGFFAFVTILSAGY